MNKELFKPVEVKSRAGDKLPEGKTIIVLNHIMLIERIDFDTNFRMLYHLAEEKIYGFPPTLHNDICSLVSKWGDKLISIEITREGTGKTDTKYRVLPEKFKEE